MENFSKNILDIILRDLDRLHKEIAGYPDEASLWSCPDGINNSAGNLCLHLVGNLNTFICATLGRSSYVRNRDFEFNGKGVPRKELLDSIHDLKADIEEASKEIKDKSLLERYPKDILKKEMSTHYFLVHLSGHLMYHLGQINYHRRLLVKT